MLPWLALAVITGIALGVLLGRRTMPSEENSASNQGSPVEGEGDRYIAEAVRSLPMGLVLADLDGAVYYRNAYANSFELGPRVTKALVRGHVRDLLGSAIEGKTETIEIDLFGPPRLRLRFSGRPVLDGDRLVAGVVMISDVTEEHRIDVVRRDFVANVSHELKTPIGAISILAETLGAEDNPETITRLTARIQTAALRLGQTVDDLLTLSAIESSESTVFEPLHVAGLVRAAIDSCHEEAASRHVVLARPDDPNSDAHVLGDRAQLMSALNNLITNAIKYSDDKATVSLHLDESAEWIGISVRDRGIGIGESDHQRIFERFYRVDSARSRSTGGTGLGLSIVRHVAVNHGGKVTVESEEGKGSTFTMHLPIAGGG